jgi:hypothetical protein
MKYAFFFSIVTLPLLLVLPIFFKPTFALIHLFFNFFLQNTATDAHKVTNGLEQIRSVFVFWCTVPVRNMRMCCLF